MALVCPNCGSERVSKENSDQSSQTQMLLRARKNPDWEPAAVTPKGTAATDTMTAVMEEAGGVRFPASQVILETRISKYKYSTLKHSSKSYSDLKTYVCELKIVLEVTTWITLLNRMRTENLQ